MSTAPHDHDRRAAARPPAPAGLRPLAVLHLAVASGGTAGFLLAPSELVRALLLVALAGWAATVVHTATGRLGAFSGAASWRALGASQVLSGAGWAAWALLPAVGYAVPLWTGDVLFLGGRDQPGRGAGPLVSKPLRRETLIAALNRWVGVAVAAPVAPVLDPDGLGELQEVAGEHWGALVDAFLDDLPSQVAGLAACLADLPQVARLAHVVKGASSTMAASRLAVAAQSLEAAALDGDGAGVATGLADVEQEATAAEAALRSTAGATAAG